ncbi:putative inner membrane protein with transglycosylase-associated domain (modular protein) [Rhizobium mesoamericanum STM3625]|uniref:Putative inner membrane protein with transglycosylase-associated domain (Modular protein) n=2 Tax=Rhizobium mesoamericanum TaxID=1079800 RepID=K0PZT6_9HYPH|nr:putative inner membrane protein with transglycosylase-associated domain (modular protein) [Rhizobium mesoamericanum STM3625]
MRLEDREAVFSQDVDETSETLRGDGRMEGVGWIAAIIIGGFAGWLAGKLMEARYGVLLNIVLGIVGSVVATAILAQFHIEVAGGRLGYFITGFLGACLLIFVARLVRR